MASAAARAVAAKKAHATKKHRTGLGRAGHRNKERVDYNYDVATEDEKREMQKKDIGKQLDGWQRDVGKQYIVDDDSEEDGEEDEQWDLLHHSIVEEDDIGCVENGKCCGKRHGAKCCTRRDKRRPYCMDMDGDVTPHYEKRENGTGAYRTNQVFLRLITSKIFGTIVLVAILMVTFLIGAGTYTTQNDTLSMLENIVQGWFVFEILMKMAARGPVYYFCQYWNIFDFLIVTVTMLPTSWFGAGGGSESIAILRLLRLLRMAKLMKVDAVVAIIGGLSKGMKSLGYIMVLLFLVYYVFAIGGMMLFAQNDPMHFQTLHDSLLTLFRVSTLEDWTDIMYLNMFGCGYTGYEYPSFNHPGATGKYDDPKWAALIVNCTSNEVTCLPEDWLVVADGIDTSNNRSETMTNLGSPIDSTPCHHPSVSGWISAFYFIVFVVISALVMLSLFIGLVSSEIETEQQRIKDDKRKKSIKDKKVKRKSSKNLNGLVGVEKLIKTTFLQKLQKFAKTWFDEDDLKMCRKAVFDKELVKASGHLRAAEKVRTITDHFVTNTIILLAILVAAIAAGIETQDNGETPSTTALIEKIEIIILIVFGLEVIALVFAEGTRPWYYFREKMNCFDFAIVIICLVSMVADSSGDGGSAVQALRMLRLLRLLKLLDEIPELKQIVVGLQSGLSSIFFITMIMVLVYYLYAVVGLMMFQENDPHHFPDLHTAMLTLFRASTFEDWTDVMYINYLGCDKWGYADPLPDPNGGSTPVECTQSNGGSPVGAIVYFLTFVVVNAFIVLSLFIGVVTSSMIDARSDALRKKFQTELMAQLDKKFPVWLGFDKESMARRNRFKETFNDIDDDQSGFIVLDELSEWLGERSVTWSKDRRADLLDGLVVPRDDPVIKEQLNLAQYIRLHKATELDMTPKELQHDIVITEGRLLVEMEWLPARPPQMEIRVTVVACEGLTQMDSFLCFTGENDPYVRVTCLGVNKQTPAIDGGGTNPKWSDWKDSDGNEGFEMSFEISELPEEIHIRAYDEDEASADDLIGIGAISLAGKKVDTAWYSDEWVTIKSGKNGGKVKVKLHFLPEPPAYSSNTLGAGRPERSHTMAALGNLGNAIGLGNSDEKVEDVDAAAELTERTRPPGQFKFTIREGKNLTAKDAFSDNDVYVFSTLGVGKDDMVKDRDGKPQEGLSSNRMKCPTYTEATKIAEGSDEEDEDADDPYMWRSETVDDGGTDPEWYAGGETKSWDLCEMPRWCMIRAMDEDLDDDDHIGTGVIDFKKVFLERLEMYRREFEERSSFSQSKPDEELSRLYKEDPDSPELAEKIESAAQAKFMEHFSCSYENLIQGGTRWACKEWYDVKRETPDSMVDSGIDLEDFKLDPEGKAEALKFREMHMKDQRLLVHLMNGGGVSSAAQPSPENTPAKPPQGLPIEPSETTGPEPEPEPEPEAAGDIATMDLESALEEGVGGAPLAPGEREGEKLVP